MTIDYKNYPKNWKTEIRPAIIERAGNRCEVCGVENHSYGFRMSDGTFEYAEDWVKVKERGFGFYLTRGDGRIRIVCTVAHLDHDTQNNEHSNLKLMCQRCHLRYDAKLHCENARKTRKQNKMIATGQANLFEL